MLDLMAWLLVGGLVGWIASLLQRIEARRGRWQSLGVGGIGAALAGMWVAPLIGDPAGARLPPSLDAVAVASLGAVLLLIVVNAIPRIRCGRSH